MHFFKKNKSMRKDFRKNSNFRHNIEYMIFESLDKHQNFIENGHFGGKVNFTPLHVVNQKSKSNNIKKQQRPEKKHAAIGRMTSIII